MVSPTQHVDHSLGSIFGLGHPALDGHRPTRIQHNNHVFRPRGSRTVPGPDPRVIGCWTVCLQKPWVESTQSCFLVPIVLIVVFRMTGIVGLPRVFKRIGSTDVFVLLLAAGRGTSSIANTGGSSRNTDTIVSHHTRPQTAETTFHTFIRLRTLTYILSQVENTFVRVF